MQEDTASVSIEEKLNDKISNSIVKKCLKIIDLNEEISSKYEECFQQKQMLEFEYKTLKTRHLLLEKELAELKIRQQIGNHQYLGEEPIVLAARQATANEAPKVSHNLPFPDNVQKHQPKVLPNSIASNSELLNDNNNNRKSPVSLVHEIAQKRGLTVNFEVVRENTFITRCSISDMTTEGKENSKKVSKKRAAEQMIEILKKLPPLSQTQQKIKKKPMKKNRNLIKPQSEGKENAPFEQQSVKIIFVSSESEEHENTSSNDDAKIANKAICQQNKQYRFKRKRKAQSDDKENSPFRKKECEDVIFEGIFSKKKILASISISSESDED